MPPNLQGNRQFFVSLFGFVLAILGILSGMFFEEVLHCVLQSKMILRPNSPVYDNWKKPPMKLNLDVYFFNWTNPQEFYNISTKPILEELGPYRFIEEPDKVDIQWHPHNASVSYRKKSFFYFNEAESGGTLNDNIATLNAVALSAANNAKFWAPVSRKMVDVGLSLYSQQVFVTKTADELLFQGYSDEMIDIARAMPIFGDDVKVPFDKFGWFYTRNGSADLTGVFNVYTGVDEFAKIGQIHSWNYKTHSSFFDSNCGDITGSAGEFQPPNLQESDILQLFTPDLCRPVSLEFVGKINVEGIEGYKYAGGKRSVDNGTLFPENLCYCGGRCSPSGVMNISSCRFGSPVFMSYPHFYSADEYYLNQVEGVHPNAESHEFYMILEPKTGIALEVAARFQVNMLVEPIESISLYEEIPTVYFPLIWFEQKVRITPELANNLKVIPILLLAGHITSGLVIAIGLILLFWYPTSHLCRKLNLRTTQPPLDAKFNYPLTDDFKEDTLLSEKLKMIDSSFSPLLDNEKNVKIVTVNNEEAKSMEKNKIN